MTAPKRPAITAPRKLKVTTTVLLRPGETLQLQAGNGKVVLYARTPKRRQWRSIAQEGR